MGDGNWLRPGQAASITALVGYCIGSIGSQRVRVEVRDIDRYRRAVSVVRLSGRDINQEMVREGFAGAYRQYLDRPYASEYIQAEETARRERRGLWRQGNPQPPWEFRKGLRSH